MILTDRTVIVDERSVPPYMLDAGRLYCAAKARVVRAEQKLCVECVDGYEAVRYEAQRDAALLIMATMLAVFSEWMGSPVTHVEMKNNG